MESELNEILYICMYKLRSYVSAKFRERKKILQKIKKPKNLVI